MFVNIKILYILNIKLIKFLTNNQHRNDFIRVLAYKLLKHIITKLKYIRQCILLKIKKY